MYDSIDIKEIDRINISTYNNSSILDIRDKYEYILSHINNSINIPYNYLLAFPHRYLDFNNKYYIYCESGIKSRKICLFLSELGYNVVDLLGGYNSYIDDK